MAHPPTGQEFVTDTQIVDCHITMIMCADGWRVGWSPWPVKTGEHAGRFVTVAYKPVGFGARSGNPAEWRLVTVHPARHRRTYSRLHSAHRLPSLYALRRPQAQ